MLYRIFIYHFSVYIIKITTEKINMYISFDSFQTAHSTLAPPILLL